MLVKNKVKECKNLQVCWLALNILFSALLTKLLGKEGKEPMLFVTVLCQPLMMLQACSVLLIYKWLMVNKVPILMMNRIYLTE